MEPLILIILFLSFLVTYLTLPFWIRKTKEIGLVWEDMHKPGHPKNVSGSGGMIVLGGTTIGILLYIALNVFVFHSDSNLIQIFAILTTMLIAGAVGIVDDFFGWHRGGLSKRSRIILVLFASVPLMVINAGHSSMDLPFFGIINFGIFYPLIIIPIGIIGATTTFNLLAGMNGLEAGQGILILSSLSIVTWLTGNSWLSVISLIMVLSLLAFYIFNKYPSEVFPGDVLTYSVGAFIACIAILGNVEKIAVFFFIPYIVEIVLKIRGRLKKESFAKLNSDETLEMPYEKIYSLTHLAIYILKKIKPSKKVYEKDVVRLINLFQVLIIALGFAMFWSEIAR